MTFLIEAGLALPDAMQSIQTDFAVCVEGNRILATGISADLRARYPQAERFGGAPYMMLPAFTNSHDHGRAIGTASLGIPDDLLEIWLPMLWSQPGIPPYLAAAYEGIQLLRTGVGTVAHSHNPLRWDTLGAESAEALRGYRDVGIRVAFHPPYIDQNPLVYAERETFLAGLPSTVQEAAQLFLQPIPLSQPDYFQLSDQLWHEHHDAINYTVHIQISPAGGQWCSDPLILASVDWAREHQTRVQMHLLETRYQRIYAFKQWGKSFIRHLEDIGALGPWLTLAHMVCVEGDDLALLAERGVGIAHNPSSNLRLRSGVAPLADMLAASIRVGIGLDGHALDDDQDYLREMRLAYTLGNRPAANSPALSAGAILQRGTSDGTSITLGPNAPLGKLAEGYLADVVLIDWQAVRGEWCPDDLPTLDGALDFLLRRATRQHITDVMVNGSWVVREGHSTTLNASDIAHEIRAVLNQRDRAQSQPVRRAAESLAPYLRRFYAQWES